jgi:hypothetical protein
MMETLKRPVNWRKIRWWVLGCVVFPIALFALLEVSFHTDEAYRMAMEAANANLQLVARIGQPIQAGLLISGSVEANPASGKADLAIPVSGPKGNGTLYVAAVKKVGRWSLTDLTFGENWSPKQIDLLPH